MNYEFVLEVYGNRTNLEFITSCDTRGSIVNSRFRCQFSSIFNIDTNDNY